MKNILPVTAFAGGILLTLVFAPRASSETFAGKLNAATKTKMYTLKMNKDRIYRITMRSAVFDTFVYLLDPAGKKVAENDDIDAKNRNSRLVFRPKKTGAYQIIATSFQQKGKGLYVLTVDTFVPKSKATNFAGKIDKNSPIFAGKLPYQSFKIKMEAGKIYVMEATSKQIKPVIAVRKAGGQLLESANVKGEAHTARMIYAPAKSGEYEILVAPFQPQGRGEFALKFQRIAAETGDVERKR